MRAVKARQERTQKQQKLENRMRRMLLGTFLPMAVMMILILGVFIHYTQCYNELSKNLAVSSEFNLLFKEKLDEEMYYITIGRWEKEKLPLDRVNEAIDTVEKLNQTTYQEESMKSLKNLNAYLTNLKRRMKQLTEIKEYDARVEFMDNNIRILTSLVMQEMQNYIYEESMYLVKVESRLARSSTLMAVFMAVIFTVTAAILLLRSFRLSSSITSPITKILKNVRAVGKGNFQVEPVETDSSEIGELDAGIRKMAGRISTLVENIKKEEEMQHLTQLQLLQAQVSPHFLYNTLDTIVWLIEGGQEDDALDMISSLSVFFRTSLSKGNDVIPLYEEERHTLSYLEIQQSRYRDIMEFEIRIPESIRNVQVPKLTLQPLAENALYHGIKNKRGKGRIYIEGEDLGGDILLRVSDTGQGMTPERLSEVQEAIRTGERAGFGLAAVSERIRLYYGPDYGMKISSTEGEGTVIEVRLSKEIQLKS